MGTIKMGYGRCVICGKIGYALRESVTVCGEHMEAIDDGWTIEVKDGEYSLVDLEEIDYPPYALPEAPAPDSAPGAPDTSYASGYASGMVDAEPQITTLRHANTVLNTELASLRDQLAAMTRERDAAVELLATVERNLPQQQPVNMGIPLGAANYSAVYNAWYAGELIRKALDTARPADEGE